MGRASACVLNERERVVSTMGLYLPAAHVPYDYALPVPQVRKAKRPVCRRVGQGSGLLGYELSQPIRGTGSGCRDKGK